MRFVRRPSLYRLAIAIAALAVVGQVLLIVLGFPLLFSADNLSKGTDLGTAPTWSAIAFAIPVAMLAFTGLETVANLAAETREPGRTLPRSLFVGIGGAVLISFLIGLVALSAYPADPETALGTTWLRAPLVGLADAFNGHLPAPFVDALRVFIGLTGAMILDRSRHDLVLGRGTARVLARQARHAPAAARSPERADAHLPGGDPVHGRGLDRGPPDREGRERPGAVPGQPVQLRRPDRVHGRPGRRDPPPLHRAGPRAAVTASRGTSRIRGTAVPVAALVGAPLTFAIWIAALLTHDAARIAGPIWLAIGAVLFVASRLTARERVLGRVTPAIGDLVPDLEGVYEKILVPMKIGLIGEEVLGTALRLAEEQRCSVLAIHVIRVPMEKPFDAPMFDAEEQAEASLAEAKLLAADANVPIVVELVRARSIGSAIVEAASSHGVDLIVLGSAPRWRRQSRFFSPTVDYVLRKAPCEVMVIAYPQGVLEEALA